MNSYQVSRCHVQEENELLFIDITVGTQFSLWIHLALNNTAKELRFIIGQGNSWSVESYIFIKMGCLL